MLWPNGSMDQDATWEEGRPRPGIVLDGNPAPLPKRGQSPQFSAHVYCGQTASWIKMLLGMEVGLGPGHIAVDGNPAPLPKKGAQPPLFGPRLLCSNGSNDWMDQDATWYGGRPRAKRHCVRWEPAHPPQKEAEPPVFGLCLGQTAKWIKMPLGTMGGLGPDNILLDADPAPPPRAQSPKFRPILFWPNG